jgi:two-component system, NarL family, sensor kinase
MNDADIPNLVIVITLVAFTLVSAIIIFLFLLQKRYFKHKQEKQLLQEEILRTQLEIQEQTLQNISQEIHDNIGQLISVVKINLNSIEEEMEENPHQEMIVTTNKLVSEVSDALRHLAKGINPDFVEQYGLVACIQNEQERLQNIVAFHINFYVKGDPYKLDISKEFVLYRVLQENLNNIIKHARATEVNITLDYRPGQCRMQITDNGKGFSPDEAENTSAARSGMGLRNMKKRIELVGGQFDIKSVVNLGTEVELVVPHQHP